MGGGPSKSTEKAQANLANEQASQGQLLSQIAQQEYNRSIQPFNTALLYNEKLASGNPEAITNAIAPSIAQATAQESAAKRSIEASVPRGGAQQLAEAELPIQTASTISTEANQAYNQAFTNLANLATGQQSLSSTSFGLSLSGTQGAAQTYAQVGQEQAAGKASTMGFLGSLAGGAASIGSAAILA